MTKKTKRPKPEVGQTMYVTISGWSKSERRIFEFIVTKVNTVSFYAHRKENNIERRFSLKTFTANNSIGDTFHAYFDRETPERLISLAKERKELIHYCKGNIHKLNIGELEIVKEMIDSK